MTDDESWWKMPNYLMQCELKEDEIKKQANCNLGKYQHFAFMD